MPRDFDPNPARPEREPVPDPPTPGPWWALAVGPTHTMPYPRTQARFAPFAAPFVAVAMAVVVDPAAGMRALTESCWDYCRSRGRA
jgi:hypothetical protein